MAACFGLLAWPFGMLSLHTTGGLMRGLPSWDTRLLRLAGMLRLNTLDFIPGLDGMGYSTRDQKEDMVFTYKHLD